MHVKANTSRFYACINLLVHLYACHNIRYACTPSFTETQALPEAAVAAASDSMKKLSVFRDWSRQHDLLAFCYEFKKCF